MADTADDRTKDKADNKMGYAPIGKLLITMSLLAILSMMVGACYNIVDSMYVAQLGQNALTALSLAFPVQTLMFAVSMGATGGVNSLIARSLGAKLHDRANDAARHGLIPAA